MAYSSFWVDKQTKKSLDRGELDFPRLAAIKRSISDFVRILTGKPIPVKFKTEEEGDGSYTDGRRVVISSDITTETFDQTVGVALHEASHIVKSDFDLIRNMDYHIPQELKEKAHDKHGHVLEDTGKGPTWLTRLVKTLVNYIEDRRIDNWVFTTSPGYKGYYHSMYDAYWHSEEVSEKLESDMFRDETLQSYMTRIINLTNPNTDLDALDELRTINSMIDLNNIGRYASTKQVMDTALEIADLLVETVEEIEFDENYDIKFEIGEGEPGDGESCSMADLSEEKKEALKEAIQKQIDFLDGDIDKEAMNAEDADELDALEDAGVSQSEVGEGTGNPSKIDCVVIDKISRSIVNKARFSCVQNYENDRSIEAVREGIRLGRMLGRKLKVRSEKRDTRFTRRKSGKIDNRLLSELTYNNRIFQQTEIDEYNEAFIHVSVDASGSMSREKWFQAMSTSVAIAQACSMINNIRVQISFRGTTGGGWNAGSKPVILMAYDSAREGITHIKQFFPYIKAGGTTPEGLAFEAIMDKLVYANKGDTDAYFVNLSDGLPNFGGSGRYGDFTYRGSVATDHTRRMVSRIRKRGIKVISYYIDGSRNPSEHSGFNEMYGRDAQYISVDNVHQISKTMNDKFLEK